MTEEEKCGCGGNCSCNENCDCNEDDCECDEVEEIEFNLSADEIDEWINELTLLKEEKGNIILDIDDELSLKINYDNLEEEK
jgi:hypothetical protein